jgi:putative nucleotidyltransferase with HDIG domain
MVAEEARAATRARRQAVIKALTATLDAYDRHTGQHSRETAQLASEVAECLGLEDVTVSAVADVALLHDLGKLAIPSQIVDKPGPLTPVELATMRRHPVIAEEIVLELPEVAHLATAIRHEHERWDGHGYPDRLVREQIPLASRIVLACDAWHAMTTDRPYREALPRGRALAELRRGAGTQFDPRVVAALLRVLGERLLADAAA